MTRSSWFLSLLLAQAFATLCAADDRPDSDVFECASHGFTIEREDTTWTFQQKEDGSTGGFTLSVLPAGSKGETLLSVQAAPLTTEVKLRDLLDETIEKLRGQKTYLEVKRASRRIAGQSAPGLRVVVRSGGVVYRARQYYATNDGMLYTIKCHAPRAEFDRHESAFNRGMKSIRFIAVTGKGRDELMLRALASRCGSEVEWAEDWQEAARRARQQKRLILVYARFYSGFTISDAAMAGPFMDRDIVDLINERFVALRLTKQMQTPLSSRPPYGLSLSSFGTSLMVVLPDGELVRETFSTETTVVHNLLVEALRRQPKYTGSKLPRQNDSLERAALLSRRGDLDQADSLLAGDSTAKSLLLRARLLRRLLRGPEALELLEKAGDQAEGELLADVRLEQARVYLKMGLTEAAEEPLADAGSQPDVLYWRGAIFLAQGRKDEADNQWRELARSHPESRWAWKAAASLKSTTFQLGVGERLDWPDARILESVRMPEPAPLNTRMARSAERDACRYLLTHQRDDGSWICPGEVNNSSTEYVSPLTEAITAICADALRRFANDDQEALAAVGRAVVFLRSSHAKAKAQGEKTYFMDYTVWSKGYVLRLLANLIEEGREPRESDFAAELVADLRAKQKPGGGWSYYVSGSLDQTAAPPNQSISFTTAAATLSLLRAREVGIEVPDEMLDAALGCVERMKNQNGTFTYFLHHDDETQGRRAGRPGAAGRGPLCELTLLRGQRGSVAAVRAALDLFLEQKEGLAAEQGKALMHCGPDGQGSHYVLFDYQTVASAIAELPEKQRRKYSRPLIELLLRARTEDGGFVDNPLIGRAFGAAMALQTFALLAPLPPEEIQR